MNISSLHVLWWSVERFPPAEVKKKIIGPHFVVSDSLLLYFFYFFASSWLIWFIVSQLHSSTIPEQINNGSYNTSTACTAHNENYMLQREHREMQSWCLLSHQCKRLMNELKDTWYFRAKRSLGNHQTIKT